MRLTIVVPVYNSESILPTLVEHVSLAARSQGWLGNFELILVNDCSPDGSWSVIQDLAGKHDFVRGICLRRNFGQHSATMAGLRHAQGDTVVIMDDDLQHPPAEIARLLAAIEGGADVCYTRYQGRQHALWKKAGSWFNDRVASLLLDKPKDLYLSSFRALSKPLVSHVIEYDGPYPYLDGLILDATRAIETIDIQHQARHEGLGNYNLSKSISLWLRMATSFSVIPLRVATVLGLCLAALSLLFAVIVVVHKLLNPDVAVGWTSLIVTVLFVGGTQLFCVGVLGEYLGRTYLRINGKPQFVVRETTWMNKSE